MDQLPDLRDLPGVQAYGGLVQDDDVRVPQNGLGNAHPLPVALGQVPDEPVTDIGDLGQVHDPVHLLGQVFHALGPGHKPQILPGRPVHVHRGLLREVPQVPLCRHGILENVYSVNAHLSGGGGKTSGENVHGGGFSRPVGPQKAVDLPIGDGKGQVRQGKVVSVPLCQVGYFNQRNFLPIQIRFILNGQPERVLKFS